MEDTSTAGASSQPQGPEQRKMLAREYRKVNPNPNPNPDPNRNPNPYPSPSPNPDPDPDPER